MTPAPLADGRITPERLTALRSALAVGPEGHELLPVPAPFTGQAFAAIPRSEPGDVTSAIARARAAQAPWESAGANARAAVAGRFADLLLRRREEGLDLIQLECGKARLDALEELGDLALFASYLSRNAPRILAPRRRQGVIPLLSRAWEHRRPFGVVGVIAPWNYPLNLAIGDSLAALIAGNAVVLKPDHQTTHVAAWGATLLRAAGLPAELLQVVPGIGPELGPALVAGVDHVMFTGSSATGRIIAGQAAERLIGCTLELGGKNPMIVLEDANLDLAVDTLMRGAFSGAGQVCVTVERVYVKQAVAAEFTRRVVEASRALRLGPAFDYSTDVGTLTSARQLERVRGALDDAVAHGATLLAGGNPRSDLGPWFIEPAVLAGVTPACRLHAEEVFGPVVSLYEVATDDEAVARANDSSYGLNASIWTRDTRRGRRLAERVRAGTVHVNDVLATAWATNDVPIGGMKRSGLGRRRGAEGLLHFTEAQAVLVEPLLPHLLTRVPGPTLERYLAPVARVLRLRRRVGR